MARVAMIPAALALTLLVACSGGGGGDASVLLRVIHASPDAPAVDIYIQGQNTPVVSGLAYGDVTAALALVPGIYTFELRASPSTVADPVAFTSPALGVLGGETVSLVAAGLLGSAAPDESFRILRLDEAFADPGAGNAAVRILHASADAPAVDLDVGDDGSVEVPALARFADTGAAGIALPAGVALEVGILAGGGRVTGFDLPALPEGATVIVVATGLLDPDRPFAQRFSLLIADANGSLGFVRQEPQVYALHLSPDTGPVDLGVGADIVVAGLAYGELAGPLSVEPGALTLDVYAPAGSTSIFASPTTPPLEAGRRYLAIATGFSGTAPGQPFSLLALEEDFVFDSGAGAPARVRVVHASPDAPSPVDVGVVDANLMVQQPPLIPGLPYAGSTPATGEALAAGALEIGVAAAGSPMPAARFDLTLTEGLRAFAIAGGSLGAPGAQPFGLTLVVTSGGAWTAQTLAPLP